MVAAVRGDKLDGPLSELVLNYTCMLLVFLQVLIVEMISEIKLPQGVADKAEWISYASKLKEIAAKYAYGQAAGNTTEEIGDLPSFEVTCEMCNAASATIYCDQDKAHLCDECDRNHHSQTKLLVRHARLPVYHSPFQFGFCKEHSGDKYECVCLECGELLCQLCLLVGSHANLSEHPIVSTIDAFRISLSPGAGFIADPDGVKEIIVKRTYVSEAFFAVSEKRKALLEGLKQRHSLIVQAEANHSAIQHTLDKQLRTALDSLDRLRRRRIEYLQALRREHLLLLTLIEWFQAFLVHARLALPPSIWLVFFRHTKEEFRNLLLPNQSVEPVEVVARFIETLPRWVTSRIDVQGFIDVYAENLLTETEKLKVFSAGASMEHFEWVPQKVLPVYLDPTIGPETASPETLRKNRMAARLDELLEKPQEVDPGYESVKIPLPSLAEQPVPLDNVQDFVMQTLAVLAESENRIPYLDFPDVPEVDLVGASAAMNENPKTTGNEGQIGSSDQARPTAEPSKKGLPPPVTAPSEDNEKKLRSILIGGQEEFANAVSVITAAPSSERQELIRTFVYLFRQPENGSLLEALIRAICVSTVTRIEASSFLVSGISMLVPLTAAFSLSLYPQDSVFLDLFLQDLVTTSMAGSSSAADTTSFANSAIAKFLALISAPSSAVSIPRSIRFLLRTVHEACTARFSPQVSIGVVTGLFVARIVSPRLIFSSPKSPDMQAPPVITLMTRFLHRIAGAAAEGQSALTGIGSTDPDTAIVNAAISQVNGLITRTVLSVPAEGLPSLTGGLSPRSAAVRIDKKLREYNSALNNLWD
jgi:hypothetical protein